MRIAIIDTVYQEFLRTVALGSGAYEEELQKFLRREFGTSDYYSREFRKIGWSAIDVIANYASLQAIWRRENGIVIDGAQTTAMLQIERFKPDVVFVQDLSFFSTFHLKQIRHTCLLVAQCSCELPDLDRVRQFHAIFTSFPHYVPKLQALGVNAVYMPLAFHESVLKWDSWTHTIHEYERDIDVSFVGGIGRQWTYGQEVLEAVAREIPTFQWWGYGYHNLSPNSPLVKCWRGPAWGDEMYRIYQRSKIVINRHGEIAQGYSNNMRLYEATGCGAVLLTEYGINLQDQFACSPKSEAFGEQEVVPYESPAEAVNLIYSLLETWPKFSGTGKRGQQRTLSAHTYAHRIPKIAEVLEKALVSA